MNKYRHSSRLNTMSSIAHRRILCREDCLKETLHMLVTTQNRPVDSSTYLQLLQTCIAKYALSEGKLIHSFITDRAFTFATRTLFRNKLINMYVKCGSLVDARKVFDEMTEQDCFSWNVIIAAYQRHGLCQEALTLFHQMQRTNVAPDHFTFASILSACAKTGDLERGMDLHESIIERGFLSNIVVASALMDMYAKCGSIQKARELFDEMPERDVVSWTGMITGYVQNGVLDEALRLFKKMPHPNAVSWNAIIAGYAQNGVMDEALRLFKEMPQSNVVSWNAIIAGYAQNGLVGNALDFFKQMQRRGVAPNRFTFSSILPACAKMEALKQGMDIHQSIIEKGFLSDVVIRSALIDMYAKCGSIQKARQLFDKIPKRDVVSWNAMIAGYAQNGALDEALRIFKAIPQPNAVSWNAIIAGYAQNGFVENSLDIFKQMQQTGVQPDQFTFASILPTCAKMGALTLGMDIHRSIIESGFLSNVVVGNALLDMYAKFGSTNKARALFDKMTQFDVVSWNAMIAGYAQNGAVDEAVRLFKEMPQPNVVSWNAIISGYAQNGLVKNALEILRQMKRTVVQPNQFTFASILPACAKMGALKQGMDIHQSIIKCGLLSDTVVGNALMDMYAKCGSTEKARKLFDKMCQPNMVSWTTIIAGYAQSGLFEKALEIFKKMQLEGVKQDSTTFASILPACAKMGALEQGMEFHQKIIESGFLSDVVVANALIDMYAKCGSIHKAGKMFDKMHHPNVISWTVMIAGYAMHGYGKDALRIFELMKFSGTHPDHISFVCALFACSHVGLVDDGCKYFNDMSNFYCIVPTMDHYVCMADLLGRAGYLEETLNFIIKMPIKPDVVVWMCLLGACRSHKNIGLGEFTATLLFELDPTNAAPYVLLSDIYAEMGRCSNVQKVRRSMKDLGLKKMPGCSWIEVHKMVHAFDVGER